MTTDIYINYFLPLLYECFGVCSLGQAFSWQINIIIEITNGIVNGSCDTQNIQLLVVWCVLSYALLVGDTALQIQLLTCTY